MPVAPRRACGSGIFREHVECICSERRNNLEVIALAILDIKLIRPKRYEDPCGYFSFKVRT